MGNVVKIDVLLRHTTKGKMISGEVFECLIAVLWDGTPVLYEAPKAVTDLQYGALLDDNPWFHCPEEHGVYRCIVKFSADDSYYEDRPAPDFDFMFHVQQVERVA